MLYGIDGCPGGWMVVSWDGNEDGCIKAEIIGSLDALRLETEDIVGIDMPIGLRNASKMHFARRECDALARKALGSRASCVFHAPARELLAGGLAYSEATKLHQKLTTKGISCQAFNILPKIKQLDDWLREKASRRHQWFEVHPELSFAWWRSEGKSPNPFILGKKTGQGFSSRLALIQQKWPGAHDAASKSLGAYSARGRKRWAQDDLLDAFAALWSAERISKKQCKKYPPSLDGQIDEAGLPMQIWA